MANSGDVKDKAVKPVSGPKFKTGVNLAPLTKGGNERRFEAGDAVPSTLTKDELKALKALDAIED